MESPDWFVIVNPAAGRGTDLLARTKQALAGQDISASVHVSADAADVTRLIDEAVAAGQRRFVAVGGDGTVNLVANALLGHEWTDPPTLGILPAGTGCDFVRVFGIAQDVEHAAGHLVGTDTYRSDAAVIEGDWGTRYFMNIAQAGIGAASATTADKLGFLRGLRYQTSFWLTLPGFARTDVTVRVGKRTYQGDAISVIFANGQFFGSGMNVAPKATLVSGEIDAQVISARKRQAPLLMRKAARGLHLGHREVHRLRGAVFSIETKDPWPVEADGEYLGLTPLRGRVLPGAIDIKI
ncbi:MAG: diacylglycerol kinase family lipid kinase [Acidimicrobiia bacterium]|nr:diacylglycerol kinase family lipid kinase [Acidimicrobiia bacterium]